MQLEISFNFSYMAPRVIENNECYVIRRAIAMVFEHSGFGRILELADDKFANEFIHPYADSIIDDQTDLYMDYLIDLPYNTNQGDLGRLLTENIPRLFQDLHTEFPELRCHCHTTYFRI